MCDISARSTTFLVVHIWKQIVKNDGSCRKKSLLDVFLKSLIIKNSAVPPFFNPLLCVWKSDETRLLVFDMSHHKRNPTTQNPLALLLVFGDVFNGPLKKSSEYIFFSTALLFWLDEIMKEIHFYTIKILLHLLGVLLNSRPASSGKTQSINFLG